MAHTIKFCDYFETDDHIVSKVQDHIHIPSLNMINISFFNAELSMFTIETQQTTISKKAGEHFFLESLYTIRKLVYRKIV